MTTHLMLSPSRIAAWHWSLPLLVALVTAPLWLGWYEPAVFYFLNRQFAVLPDIVWSLLSLFGTGWAIYAVTAPALWRAPRLILAWLCAAPLAGLLTRLGKMWAFSPRPLEVLGSEGINVIGEPLFIAAMPSGHSLTAFTAAAAIYFSFAPQGRRHWVWLFVFAFAVACSRIAVGAHWPADASVGAAAGLFHHEADRVGLVQQAQAAGLLRVFRVARVHEDAATHQDAVGLGHHAGDPAHVEVLAAYSGAVAASAKLAHARCGLVWCVLPVCAAE